MTEVFDVPNIIGRLAASPDALPWERLVSRDGLEAGMILFRVEPSPREQFIEHPDKSVLAYVLEGSGYLRVGEERRELQAGSLVHIPPGTPHDFWAAAEPLLLLYALAGASTLG